MYGVVYGIFFLVVFGMYGFGGYCVGFDFVFWILCSVFSIDVGMKLDMLLFRWVILWISEDEMKLCCLVGVRNNVLIFGIRWWFMFVIWNLYLKLDIVCRLCSSMLFCMECMKCVSNVLKLCIFMLWWWVSVLCVSDICSFSGSVGFFDGFCVIFIIIFLNSGVVWFIRLM